MSKQAKLKSSKKKNTKTTISPGGMVEGKNRGAALKKPASPIDKSSSDKISNKLTEASGTPRRNPKIEGHFDDLDLRGVSGWAYDSNNPNLRLDVEVLIDGRVAGRVTANNHRSDLLEAGIGDGQHSFVLRLSHDLFDDQEHNVQVREVSSGTQLPGSPRTFRGFTASKFDMSLDGTALCGWALVPEHDGRQLRLCAMEGENQLSAALSEPEEGNPHLVRFRLPLNEQHFDGRAHSITILVENPRMVVAQSALFFPRFMTPPDALQKYASSGVTPSISNVPGFRYNTFSDAISKLSSSLPTEQYQAALAQVVHCHKTLIRGANGAGRRYERLNFPQHTAPAVSIVIPVHNKFSVTYHCLASLLLAPNHATFEVIIVDDGSSDDTLMIPSLVDGITYLRNEESAGFILASNRGGEKARGEYVVMLNNDTEVLSGWLDELLWPFRNFDAVGMTGAKLIYPDGRLQEAGGIVWSNGNPWNYGRNGNPGDPRFNYTRQVDYLSGACVMLPTSLWKELGGFDTAFVPAYFEDTDLAFRVRDKGFKTVYAPKAQVIHYEGVSSGTSVTTGTKRFQEINRPKFKNRWTMACRNNGKEGVDVERNKDRNVDLRALVIDFEAPQPDKSAGGYAAFEEIKILQALGFKCTFFPLNLAWLAHYTENLERIGVECVYAPFSFSADSFIKERGAEFDIVYITRYNAAEHLIDAIRQHAPQAKIVLNNADLHFLRELRGAIEIGSKEAIGKAIETRERELLVMRRVDLVLCYTDVEKAVIQSHNLDSTRLARCPWVSRATEAVPGFNERSDIAFLGGYDHPPNAEAVEWFVVNVWPLLRTAIPEIKFRVYGSNVPKKLTDLGLKDDRVVIEGWVEEVREVYDRCRVFVAPLRSGAGIKGKVIGALCHGLPTVLSPIAAEGIAIADGVDGLVADKPESWVSAIKSLYSDKTAWELMSKQAIATATRQFGSEKGTKDMQSALLQTGIFTSTEIRGLAARK